MKTTLSVLAFVALAATCAATATSAVAWLGDWIPPMTQQPIGAIAINSDLIKTFRRQPSIGGVVLTNVETFEGVVQGPEDICGGTIGIHLTYGETFCGLYLIGFIRHRYHVLLVMRFEGLNGGDREYQLEIPLFLLTPTENIGPGFIFFRSDWYEHIGLDSRIDDTVVFHFEWFEFIVNNMVVRVDSGYPLDRPGENPAKVFQSRRVLLPEDAFVKLYTIQ